MSKWSLSFQALTLTAVADNTNYTDSGYIALVGGSTTQIINIWEVMLGGQATSSAPTFAVLALDSTIGVTLTALGTPNAAGPLNPASAALAAPPVGFIIATTKPKRSNSITFPKLSLSFNAFGGIAFWRAGDEGSCFQMLGNAASTGEASISAVTGGTPGAMGGHMIYEPK